MEMVFYQMKIPMTIIHMFAQIMIMIHAMIVQMEIMIYLMMAGIMIDGIDNGDSDDDNDGIPDNQEAMIITNLSVRIKMEIRVMIAL